MRAALLLLLFAARAWADPLDASNETLVELQCVTSASLSSAGRAVIICDSATGEILVSADGQNYTVLGGGGPGTGGSTLCPNGITGTPSSTSFLRGDCSWSDAVVTTGGNVVDGEVAVFAGTNGRTITAANVNARCTASGAPADYCIGLQQGTGHIKFDSTTAKLLSPAGFEENKIAIAPGASFGAPTNNGGIAAACTDDPDATGLNRLYMKDGDGASATVSADVCANKTKVATIPVTTGSPTLGKCWCGDTIAGTAAWQTISISATTSTTTSSSTSSTAAGATTSTSSTSTSSTTSTSLAGACTANGVQQLGNLSDYWGTTTGDDPQNTAVHQEISNSTTASICRIDVCLGNNGGITGTAWLEIWNTDTTLGAPANILTTQAGPDSGTVDLSTVTNSFTDPPTGACGSAGNGTAITFTWSGTKPAPTSDYSIVMQMSGTGTVRWGTNTDPTSYSTTDYDVIHHNIDRDNDAYFKVYTLQ